MKSGEAGNFLRLDSAVQIRRRDCKGVRWGTSVLEYAELGPAYYSSTGRDSTFPVHRSPPHSLTVAPPIFTGLVLGQAVYAIPEYAVARIDDSGATADRGGR